MATIWRRKKLLSIGYNEYTTDPKVLYLGKRFNIEFYKRFHYLHAEVSAIINLWGKIHLDKRHTLIVVRLSQTNRMQLSKPCPNCQKLLEALSMKYYWSEDED